MFISGQQQIPYAQVIDFTADPPQIEEGGSTRLSWKTENAEKVTLSTEENAPGESIEPAGTKIVHPQGTTVFFLKAQGTDPAKKVDVARITVTVTPTAIKPDPQIVVFEADRKVLIRGDSTALHWETANASRIELDDATVNPRGDIEIRPDKTTIHWRTSGAIGVELIPFGKVGLSGSKTVSPGKTTTYILTAWGSEKQSTRQKVTITVDSATVSGGTVILAGGGKYLDDKRVIYAIFYGVPFCWN